MTATRTAASPWLPGPGWWAGLTAVIGTGIVANWAIAGGLLAWLLVQRFRPFDFVVAFLALVAGGCFVAGAAGGLTYQLSYLTVGVLVMLACYVIAMGRDVIGVPWTSMTMPLLFFGTLSIANTVRGVLAGYSSKYVFLEAYPLLALGTTALVANAFQARRDLRLGMISLIVIAYAIGARGYLTFSSLHWHAKGEYTVATPGIIAILLINLALRSSNWGTSLGWTLLSLPLFVHQFLTFGRGLWTGCAGGMIAAFLIYARVGRGSAARVRRAALVYGLILLLGVLGAIAAATVIGDVSVLQQAGTRASSITSTEGGYESRSNIIRLWEYATVLRHIGQSPWFGHGIGFTFPVEEPFGGQVVDQSYVHQNYLLVWLKQGITGLALFLWLLVASIALAARASWQRTEAWESAWLATAATATIYLAIFSLSNSPFAVVNEMFLLALLWGGAMSMTGRGRLLVRWKS